MINYLEGKARESFDNWRFKKCEETKGSISPILQAEHAPDSMQFGLIQEWAENEGEFIETQRGTSMNGDVLYYTWNRYNQSEGGFKTRQEAQQESVKKLNEILNNVQ